MSTVRSNRIKFNQDVFDVKVAKITSHIHYRHDSRKKEIWIDKNRDHLENMYNLINLECGFVDFCNYIYLH